MLRTRLPKQTNSYPGRTAEEKMAGSEVYNHSVMVGESHEKIKFRTMTKQ